MKYNKRLYQILTKYLKKTNAKWCILGAEERNNSWRLFLYDTKVKKRRSIFYLFDLILENKSIVKILTESEIKELAELTPPSYASKFAF